ncbi:sulfite reductase (ferredoxin) [Anseongella ginsenosidimutans]|uniref:Sulfite reductase (Ferredoxin) n=1 Tax=Anseongella ginsenosidimutans TaxID=496056 RepID=A0A4R3KQ44_9SPHI|nr:HEPN domain-containing protein [Anseongella ginsenosidimutans]QEC53885.1 HEPN domain-containing protein [Anseongella ginsenosidimutans]TCS86267.1 sulfite reductase (ferredoxin) [Anseongella ginsenosidimutans]
MQSFRTELENPVVEREIIELEKKIRRFHEGAIPETKFRSLRLARGIYGQRQKGVQMVRIKIPFGFLTFKKLLAIADVSDEYATGNLHLTTRQDIQIHFVSLDRTPELWAQLDKDEVTIREACGNTVRNVTASPIAGIDPDEPFDVSPYAYETFRYFLRNPICQDMGRKFKVAFSSAESDTAWSFIHDVGLIPKLRQENGTEVRGFKVVIGGGLGAQPMTSKLVHEFLPEDQVIPYIESVIRVFERYGERNNRNKARMKYLIANLGLEEVVRMVEEERVANKSKSYPINRHILPETQPPAERPVPEVKIENEQKYQAWLKTNVSEQKQKGFYKVSIKVQTGDISTGTARKLVSAVRDYVADDIRVAATQGLILKFARPEALPYLFSELDKLELAEPGFESVADVTTCPGTDTCNLGISDSMNVTRVFERVITNEFPELIYNNDIKIKISGCMNSCGQHGIASIGFHGSSAKAAGKVYPALQVLLGGGIVGDGVGRTAEKVIKVPSKRGPDVLRLVLRDYEANSQDGEYFNDYYDRRSKEYFYELLKPLADTSTLRPDEFIDWGQDEQFATAIGVGECASVVIDLVATLLADSEEKLELAKENFEAGRYADAIYHGYGLYINTAKALLLDEGVNPSTQIKIMNEFDSRYVAAGKFTFPEGFREHVTRINKNEPGEGFAVEYIAGAADFLRNAIAFREQNRELAETNS